MRSVSVVRAVEKMGSGFVSGLCTQQADLTAVLELPTAWHTSCDREHKKPRAGRGRCCTGMAYRRRDTLRHGNHPAVPAAHQEASVTPAFHPEQVQLEPALGNRVLIPAPPPAQPSFMSWWYQACLWQVQIPAEELARGGR